MHSKLRKIALLASSVLLLSPVVVFNSWRFMAWSSAAWAGMVFTSANDVDKVLEGSPAAAAGVKPGDHLLYVNGIASNDTELLSDFAQRARVGDTVTYEFRRGSQRLSIPIQLVSAFHNKQMVVDIVSAALTSLAFVGVGVFVYLKKPQDRCVPVFYMLCVTAAANILGGSVWGGSVLYAHLRGLEGLIPLSVARDGLLIHASFFIFMGWFFLFVVLLFHLTLVFPKERPIIRQRPYILRWVYGIPMLGWFATLFQDILGLVGRAPSMFRLVLVAGTLGLTVAALASLQRAIRSSGWKLGLLSRPATVLLVLLLLIFCLWMTSLLPETWLTGLRAWIPLRHLTAWLTFVFSFLFVLIVLPIATCVVLYRSYRESGVEEKRQVRWPLWGLVAAVLGSAFLPFGFDFVLVYLGHQSIIQQLLSFPLTRGCLLLIPVSFAFAILKYRLMDIDIIIKKTITYTLLSAILVILYFLLVGGLGVLLVRLARVQSGVITVFSTLAIAAIFVPLRTRIQGFVDRRFFRQRHDYASVLRALGREVSTAQDLWKLVQSVAEKVQQALQNRAVVIFTRAPREQTFWATVKVGLPDEIIGHLKFETDNLFWGAFDAPIALAQAELPEQEKVKLRTAKSTLLVPLKVKDALLGFISLGSKLSEQEYDANDKEFLAAVADQVAMGIDNLWLRKSEQEIEEARKIQQGLLPKEIPQFPSFEIAGAWQPARVVSGDYFDVIRLSGSKFALCIGDVVGKGMPAALLMSNLQAAVKAFASEWMPPQELCDRVNQVIASNIVLGKFITFFYALVDTERKTLVYANAGHNPPVLVRRDGCTVRFTEGGTVLGLFADSKYQQQEEELAAGDRIVLFTDGLTEATDSQVEQFGEERLIRLVASNRQLPSAELQQRILQAVREFCGNNFHDDATLVIVSVSTQQNH